MNDFEMIYRIVNKDGAPCSGYNNTGGTYQTHKGARMAVAYLERLDRRYGRNKGPYTIQSSPLNWEPVT